MTTIEIFDNPLRGPSPASPGDVDVDPTAFHRRLPGYQPTPLVSLTDVAAELGVGQLLVKDESSRLGLPAFKFLGASWASYRSLIERLGHEPAWSTLEELADALVPLGSMSLATATDGNHGRAVASFARRVGLEARIFVPDGTAQARIDAIRSEGATCEVVPGGTYEDAVARAGAEAGPDCLVVSDTSWEGYTTVPGWVIDGYATIFNEIDEQLAAAGLDQPTALLIQSGVGALAGAAAARYRGASAMTPQLICVEPDTADCLMESARAGHLVEVPGPHPSIMAGLNCGTGSPIAWPSVAAGFDRFLAIGDDDALAGMRTLAAHGVVSGETGASGLGALLGLASEGRLADIGVGPDDVVLVVSTEGATDPAFYEHAVGRSADEVRSHRAPCVASASAAACPVTRCPGPCTT